MLVGSIIIAVFIFANFLTIEKSFCNDNLEGKWLTVELIRRPAIFAVTVGLINYLVTKIGEIPWVALIFMLIMIISYIYIVIYWKREGESLLELICFILLTLFLFYPFKAAVIMSLLLVRSDSLAAFLIRLPSLVMIASIGFIVIDKIVWWQKMKKIREERIMMLEASESGEVN